MNEKQRKELADISARLQALHSDVEEFHQEEQDKYENMSENLQGGEKGERQQEIADDLNEAAESIQAAIDKIADATAES